jgi:hypothetical protein
VFHVRSPNPPDSVAVRASPDATVAIYEERAHRGFDPSMVQHRLEYAVRKTQDSLAVTASYQQPSRTIFGKGIDFSSSAGQKRLRLAVS